MYQLLGVLGLHFDASWGGINGGITIPCGINQLPLVYALYDVLEKGKPHSFDGRIVEPDEDGDIVLYTTYRKHDLPQNIQYERFKLYPEFLKEVGGEKVELTPGEPCDIPVGHWVDVRVNMPSNSIYNQK
ncbi:phage tail fiber protein [Providencia vermicola]|uniref:phage tail fiber protein n=1 Tax=Providencia vermicola TaxID=333965 RepID=UPI003FA14368